MPSHEDKAAALMVTLVGLVRLMLVVLAIPAGLLGAAAALVVLKVAAPLLLLRQVYRLLLAAQNNGPMQAWAEPLN